MPDYIPGISLVEQINLTGAQLTPNVREAITTCSLSGGWQSVTEIDMTIMDPRFELLKGGYIKDKMRVDFIGFWLEAATISTVSVQGAEAVNIKFRAGGVQALKNRTGILTMTQVSPTTFIRKECEAVGLSFVGQDTIVRNEVSREIPPSGDYNIEGEKPPSSWTTFQSLADEEGMVCFEYMNTVYFGKPSWLINNVPKSFKADYTPGQVTDTSTLNIPECSRSDDNPDGVNISFMLPLSRIKDMGLGAKVTLSGVPTFDGDFITSEISFNMLDAATTISVQAQKPIDPKPFAKSQFIPLTNYNPNSSGQARRGTKLAQDFVAWAMKQIGDKYVYGASPGLNNEDPTQFDCSALVQWALSMVGVPFNRTTITQTQGVLQQQNIDLHYAYFVKVDLAKQIRGALLYVPYPKTGWPNHVAISLGNGRTVEARNSKVGVVEADAGSRFGYGILIPQLIYPQIYGVSDYVWQGKLLKATKSSATGNLLLADWSTSVRPGWEKVTDNIGQEREGRK